MRIIIIGPPGAGKSTLAKSLGLALNIAKVHQLDFFFWKPGWKKTSHQERLEILKVLTVDNSWILEGNYTNTLSFQLTKANVAIFLHIPIHICIWRIILQQFGYLFQEPPEIAPGCRDRFSYNFLKSILTFYPVDFKIFSEEIKLHKNVKLIHLHNTREIKEFLNNPGL